MKMGEVLLLLFGAGVIFLFARFGNVIEPMLKEAVK